ncbi:MAG: GNAT family N-acetyltransferase [Clostridia bacterium]|nr:GNAT family N-acetyltransferase [Clostridia bacterium]
MIRLIAVRKEDRELFWNINQKYLYEMTNYYDDPMDENGNYHYGRFDEYFSDPERSAYFLYDGETLVGFAMINPYSCIGRDPDHTMAEFTIFPAYRRKRLAVDAVNALLEKHHGQWEIKYNEKNIAAKRLWNKIAAPYSPEVYHLNDEETVLLFTKEPD